jgi:drug/metabolite transporter (DMT)-like permease
MTQATPASAGSIDRPLAGIAAMAGASCCFATLNLVSKFTIEEISVIQMLALRSACVALLMAPFFGRAGGMALLRTGRPGANFARTGLTVVSVLLFFAGLRGLPVATAVALGFLAPLFVTGLAALLLGERVTWRRLVALASGFAGMLVIVRPGAAGMSLAALLVVASAFTFAIQQVLTRSLTRSESDATLITYNNIGMLVALGLLAPLDWQPLGARSAMLVLLLALMLIIAQWLLIRAVRLAALPVVTPFQYLELPIVAALGFALWREIPAAHVWLGAGLIVAGGLFVLLHERRAGT